MGYDVGTPLEWAAVDRSSKCIVNDEWHTILMSDTCKLLDVENGTSRIADGLAKYNFRVRTECLLDFLLAIIRIHKGAFDAEFLEGNTKEVEGATIDFIGCNDMVASLADVEYGLEVGSLTAACEHGSHTPFEFCDLLSHSVIGRVLESGIEISFFLQVKEHRHLFRVVIFECGTLNDWHLDRLAILRFIAALHTEGSDT